MPLCKASFFSKKNSCETKQGELTLWLMSTEAPHGVTFSCTHTPTTSQTSSSVSLGLLSAHEDILYYFTSQNQPSDSFGPLNSFGKSSAGRTPPPLTFSKSKSPKYPRPSNHPLFPAHIATFTADQALSAPPVKNYTRLHQKCRRLYLSCIRCCAVSKTVFFK